MQVLENAPPGQEFRMRDGTLLKDAEAMFRVLLDLPQDEYAFFVNDEKNDFASWVEHCLNDKFLAGAMRRATSREKMLKTIFTYLYA